MTLQEKLILAGAIKVETPEIFSFDKSATSLRNLSDAEKKRDVFNEEIKNEIKYIKEIAPVAISSNEEFISPIGNKDIGSVNFANEQNGASTANRDIASDVKGVMEGIELPIENKMSLASLRSANEINDLKNSVDNIGFINSANEISEATKRKKGNALNPNPAPKPGAQINNAGLANFEFYKIQADYFDNGKHRGRSQYTTKFHVTPDVGSSRKSTFVANFYSRPRDYWAFILNKGVENGPFYDRFMTRYEQILELENAGILNPDYETKLAILKEYGLNPGTGKYEFQSLENSGVIAYWNNSDDCPTIEVFLEAWTCTFTMNYVFDRKVSSNLKFMGMYLNKGMSAPKDAKAIPMVRKTSF